MMMSSIPRSARGGRRDASNERRDGVVPAPRVGAPPAPRRVGRRRAHRAHRGSPWTQAGAAVNVQPVVNTVRATLSHQAALAGADPAVAAAVNQVIDALAPALRLAAMEIAEQAATEVRAQLPGHTIDVVVVDGDPTLRVAEVPSATPPGGPEDFV